MKQVLIFGKERKVFNSLSDLANYVYWSGIKNFSIQDSDTQKETWIENPNRDWFAVNGIPYEDLYDENPDIEAEK